MFVKVWHEVNLLNDLSIWQQLVCDCDTCAHCPVVMFPLGGGWGGGGLPGFDFVG